MGVSIYPVLNKEVAGFDATEMSGKALAAAIFEEDSAFGILGRFNSQNAEWLAGFIADQTGQDPSEIKVPAEQWFAPGDGLTVVRELAALPVPSVKGATDDFAEWLAEDLQALERMLAVAQGNGALFHLAMDF